MAGVGRIWTRTRQPQTIPSVTNAPIGRGLFTLFDPKSGIDVASRQRLTTAVTVPPTRAVPPGSVGAYTQGARHELRRQLLNQPLAADDFTISATFVSYSYVALSGLFGWGYQSGTPLQSPTVGSLRGLILNDGAYYFWGYGFDWSTGVTVDVDAKQRTVTVTRTGSTLRLYNNGVQVASTTTPALVDVIAGSYVVMGNGHNSAAAAPDATILQGAGWTRALTAEEVFRHAQNPWQLYAPNRKASRAFTVGAAGGTTVDVPAGALTLTGYAPTVSFTAHQTIAVPAGALTLTGFAPTVSTSAAQTIAVPAASLTLTGFAPTVAATANQAISVPAGSLTLTGYAPTVYTTAVTTINVPAGALTLTGYAPTVSYTTHAYIGVPAGALTLTGYAPTVIGGTSSIWTPASASSGTWTPASASGGTWTPQ